MKPAEPRISIRFKNAMVFFAEYFDNVEDVLTLSQQLDSCSEDELQKYIRHALVEIVKAKSALDVMVDEYNKALKNAPKVLPR